MCQKAASSTSKKGKNKYLYEMIDPQKPERPIDVSDSKGIVARDITKQIQKAQSASEAVPEIRDKYSIRAYHGSPYDFDRFSLDAVGTGEGGTAFGSGIYLC